VFIYGALVRANTIFAAAPLLAYFTAPFTSAAPPATPAPAAATGSAAPLTAPAGSGGPATSGAPPDPAAVGAGAHRPPPDARARLWASLLGAPVAILALSAALNALVVAPEQRQDPLSSLIVFDLGGLSHAQGRNLLPGAWTPAQARAIIGCYRPDKWDRYDEGACAFVPGALADQDLWGAPEFTRAWLAAIALHPIDYLSHRGAYMNQLLRWIGDTPRGTVFVSGSAATAPGMRHQRSAIYGGYERAALAQAGSPLYRPFFWLFASLGVVALATAAAPSPARAFAAAMGGSGALYLLTYAVVGVSSDFRYAYWTVWAALAGAAALSACRWPAPPRRLLIGLAVAGAGAVGLSLLR
jgi:hypothetical protein